MRQHEIFDLLQEQGVGWYTSSGTITPRYAYNIASSKNTDEAADELFREQLSAQLIKEFMSRVKANAQWKLYTDMEGVHYKAQIYLLDTEQILSLVRAAYHKGMIAATNMNIQPQYILKENDK